MESKFNLRATDKQAQMFYDKYCVKLIEFKGDKEKYPRMDMNSSIVHTWRVILRHKDEIGRLCGIFSYKAITSIID